MRSIHHRDGQLGPASTAAGDLRIGEVVDEPNLLVACTFPLDVLV